MISPYAQSGCVQSNHALVLVDPQSRERLRTEGNRLVRSLSTILFINQSPRPEYLEVAEERDIPGWTGLSQEHRDMGCVR